MAQNVTVVYSLVDRISSKADRIQKKIERLEKTLANVDKLTSDIGKNRGIENASRRNGAALDKYHDKLKKTNGLLERQTKLMDSHARTSSAVHSGLKNITLAEHKLGDAMARKNIHARAQVKNLRDVNKATEQAERSQRKYNRSMQSQNKLLQRIRSTWNKDGAFLQGFDMGVFQYEALKKIVMILPVIGTGFGGIASMASAATVAVGGLVGAVGRLSGAAALLPGIYGAIGVTAGSIKGIQANILKPIMEGKESLSGIDKQIAAAQKSLSDAQKRNSAATTPAGSASSLAAVEKAESSLNELQKERAEIAKTMPKDAQKLLDATEKIKDTWREAWFGEGGKLATQVINDSTKALEKATQVIENSGGMFQRAADTYSNLLATGSRLLSNKKFMRPFADAVHSSFDNSEKLLKTAENLAPVVATIAANAADMTSSVLDSVVGWSEAYTAADKIAEVQEKSAAWMERGEKSLRLWVPAIGDLLSAVRILTGPMGSSFEKRFTGSDGLFAQFDAWAKKVEKNKSLEAFNTNSQKVLSAVGGVFLSIGRVVGRIGADPKAAQATTDFLHQLSSGIESFGGFALKAMKETGPAMTDLFDAFGAAHKGSGDVIISVMTSIIEVMTKMTRVADKVTPDKMLGVIAGITAVMSAAGAVIGTASIATKPLRSVGGRALSTYGQTGLPGSRAAQRVGGVADPGMRVFVTNMPASGIPGIPPGTGGGFLSGLLGKVRGLSGGTKVAGGVAAVAITEAIMLQLEKNKQKNMTPEERKARRDKANKDLLKAPMLSVVPVVGPMLALNKSVDALNVNLGGALASGDKNSRRVHKDNAWRNRSYEEKSAAAARGVKDLESNRFATGELTPFGLGSTTQKNISKKTESGIGKTTDAAVKAFERQRKLVRAASVRVGKAAVQPLSVWVARTRVLLASIGAGAAGAPGTGVLPGGSMAAAGAVSAMQGAVGGIFGDSNVPVANRFGVGDSNKPAAGGNPNTAGLSSGMGPAIALANRMGGTISSGLRPGAITSSGLPSDHSTGNAIDIAGTPGLMAQIARNANSLPGVKQVIYSPVGWSRNGGPFSPVTDAAVKADHYDHVHVAMGGSGKGGPMAALMGGTSPALGRFPNTVMGQAVGALAQQAKAAVDARLGQGGGDPASMGLGASAATGGPKSIAQAMMAQFGFGPDQFGPLDKLWTKESGWRVNADNPTSDAYGIPQALPGSKMASAGSDWATNPATQIKWGLGYIKERYGSPAAAWAHSQETNWYGNGGDFIAKRPQLIGVGDGGQERVTITPKRKAPNGNLRSVGSGNTFHTTVVVQGALFLNEEGRKQLGDMVGKHVAEQVIKASPNASIEKDL